MSAADNVMVKLTTFTDETAKTRETAEMPWRDVVAMLQQPNSYPSKTACPWIKLATFGDTPSAKGSFRHNENVTAIHGIELDYDGEQMPVAEAASALNAAGVAAVVYSSPSYSAAKPRWRVLAPTSTALPPEAREGLVASLDALLGHVAAPESYTLSQAYYYGRVNGGEYCCQAVDGLPIDAAIAFGMVQQSKRQPKTKAAPVGNRQPLPADFEQVLAMRPCPKHGDENGYTNEWLPTVLGSLNSFGPAAVPGLVRWSMDWYRQEYANWDEATVATIAERDIANRIQPEGTGTASWENVREKRGLPRADVGELFKPVEQPVEIDATRAPHPLTIEFHAESNATEFVIDDMVCEGFTVLAADRGAGKTTATVSLACKAAWLCADDDPLRPVIRRHVVYVTEHPQQVAAIMSAMQAVNVLGKDGNDWPAWFHIVHAHRMPAAGIVQAVPTYVERWCVETTRSGVTFNAPPWVIYDTASAVIKLDEENSNTDISDAVATLKQSMLSQEPPVPFMVVGHVAKAIRHANVESMTMRGGGAWEADAYQVMYLSTGDKSARYFEIGHPNAKKRFSPRWYCIEVTGFLQSRLVRNRFGEDKYEETWWAALTPLDESGSRQSKQRKKEAADAAKVEEAKRKVCEWFEKHPDFHGSKTDVVEVIGMKREIVIKAIHELNEAGVLMVIEKFLRKDGKTGSNGVGLNPESLWATRSQPVPEEADCPQPA